MTKKAKVLFVDDEERILRSLVMLFRPHYQVGFTTDANEALEIIKRERIHVIVSDQRMPIMRGADLLRQVKEVSPNTMRLLLTGYSEMDSILSSVNEGEIFRFINKPWNAQDIKATVDKAATIALSLEEFDQKTASLPVPADPGKLHFLVIDDDHATYDSVREILGDQHIVRWGANVDEALEIMSREDMAIVISEVRVQDEDISSAIKLLKQQHPNVVTIVLTSFQDTGTLIDLINQGQVYRFLPKPVRRGLLGMSLNAALKHYQSLRATPLLLQRHVVEKPAAPPPEDSRMASRILTYLSRVRSRPAVNDA